MTLGIELRDRLATGLIELIAVILLLTPRLGAFGGLLAAGLMAGAVFSQLITLGLVVKDEGGLLFRLAVATFFSSALVVCLRRGQLPVVGGCVGDPCS